MIGLEVLIGSNASAYLILAANSWMQVPWGTGSLVSEVLPWTPSLGPEIINATEAQYALERYPIQAPAYYLIQRL